MTAVPFVIGGVLWVIAGFLWVARRDARALASRFADLRMSERAVPDGDALSAIEGPAASEAPVRDPVSGEPAVWVDVRLLERDARGGERSLVARTWASPLSLGGATVDLADAQIELPLEEVARAQGVPDEAMLALLEAEEVSLADPPPEGLSYELSRRRLLVGERILVVGVPRRVGGAVQMKSAYGPLLLTREPLAQVIAAELSTTAQMDRMLALAAILGLASILVGAWLAFG